MSNWYVYMLDCGKSIYTGYTDNVEKRFQAHVEGKGAKYTRSHPPKRILLSIPCPSKGHAMSLEYAIKRLSRKKKELLLQEEVRNSFVHKVFKKYETKD